jgi:hypothetical protein
MLERVYEYDLLLYPLNITLVMNSAPAGLAPSAGRDRAV